MLRLSPETHYAYLLKPCGNPGSFVRVVVIGLRKATICENLLERSKKFVDSAGATALTNLLVITVELYKALYVGGGCYWGEGFCGFDIQRYSDPIGPVGIGNSEDLLIPRVVGAGKQLDLRYLLTSRELLVPETGQTLNIC